MTLVRNLPLFVFFTSLLPSVTVHAQGIEIKGLRIGMTIGEVEKTIGPLPVRDFTIAGVRNKYSTFSPVFHDGKLDYFQFAFDPSAFDEVASAVKDKYPALFCQNTTITNAMGAVFKQTQCSLKDKLGSLLLSRYTGQITTSTLSLTSTRALNEFLEKRNERKKDL